MRFDLSRLRGRLRLPFWHRDDIEAEIASHLQDAESDMRAQGRDETEAREAVLENLGDQEAIGDSLQSIHQGWIGGATVQRRFAMTLFSTVLLALGAAFAAVSVLNITGVFEYYTLPLWAPGWVFPTLVLFWLAFVPGLAAGVLWRIGGGGIPQMRKLMIVVIAVIALCGIAWLAERFTEGTSPGPFTAVWHVPVLIMLNIYAFSLSIRVGRRAAHQGSPTRVVVIAVLGLLLAASTWVWRERAWREFMIRQSLHQSIQAVVIRYHEGRTRGRYDEVIACLSPEYLRRELGSPPYAPKLRRAFEGERAQFGPNTRGFVRLYGPTPSEPIPGSSARRARVEGGFHGLWWTWSVTFVPYRRTWRISDMRLTPKHTELPPNIRLVEGPAGTVRILSLPKK